MEPHPSEAGGAPEGPGERGGPSPRWRRVVRVLGLAQVVAAWLEFFLVAGSIWILCRLRPAGIRLNLDKPLFLVWLIERLLALPALIALSFWIGRGLIGRRRSAVLGQTTLSALAAFWALHSAGFDWDDLQFSIESLDEFREVAAKDIGYYLMKSCSGFAHAAVALILFRAWRRMPVRDVPDVGGVPGRRFGFVGYCLAFATAVPLAFGTVGTAHWLVLKIHRYVTLHAIPA